MKTYSITRNKKIAGIFAFVAGLFAGIYFIGLGSIHVTLAHVPGDLGDARFNNYLLEHAWQYFSGILPTYWDAPFMYPEQDVITYSDNLLGAVPFYALFRLMGYERETAFQFWYLLMCVLNYASAYFLLRYLFKNTYAAVCGALIFAFSIALQSQMGHAQTFPRFMIPMAIWMSILFFKELRIKYFFLILFCLVYQLYCGFYLGFMLCIPVGIFMISTVFFKKGLYRIRLKSRRWIWGIIISCIVNILLVLPIVIPYLRRAGQMGFYDYKNIVESLPTMVSYFYSHHGSLFWDFINNIGVSYPAFWDHQIFPGGVAIVSLIVAAIFAGLKLSGKMKNIVLPYPNVFKILLITACLTFLLFLRVGDFSLYRIIFSLPGFGAMRALQRIINIELIFISMAVTFSLTMIFKHKNILGFILFMGAIFLIIADNRIHHDTVHKYEKANSLERVGSLVAKVGQVEEHKILSFEPDSVKEKIIFYQLDAMLAAQQLKIKTLNGYTATSPPGYSGYWISPNEETRMIWLNTKKLSGENILVIR